jgi:hypothetical protein
VGAGHSASKNWQSEFFEVKRQPDAAEVYMAATIV